MKLNFKITFFLFVLLATAGETYGATITVNSNDDSVKVDGKCTLREAIIEANLTPLARINRLSHIKFPGFDCDFGSRRANTIVFLPKTDNTPFCLNRFNTVADDNAKYGDLDITSDITIRGNGSDKTVIDGAHPNSTATFCQASLGSINERVFHVISSGKLTIKKLTVKGGYADSTSTGGAGIKIETGSLGLDLEDAIITDNKVASGLVHGGGISADTNTSLTINKSTISSNDDYGIYGYENTITITNSSIRSNHANGIYAGGATTQLSIDNTTISSNYGGVYLNAGQLTLKNSAIVSNAADYGGYGYAGISLKSTNNLNSITNSTISENYGIGIKCDGSTFTLSNSTIALTKNSNNYYIHKDFDDGINSSACTINIKSSIVTDDIVTDAYVYTDDGFNFLKDTQSSADLETFFETFDTTATDHGGPTVTLALYGGNATIGAGDCAIVSTDQRGQPRQNPCSIGAYEYLGTDPTCGDGHVASSLGETCDDGNSNNNDDCLNNCTLATCGDGVLNQSSNSTEQCDNSSPDCNQSSCTFATVSTTCGDGTVDADQGEACDDGSSNSDSTPDTCRTTCQFASCGDGVVDPNNGEICDEGFAVNGTNASTCSTLCLVKEKLSVCGDGNVDADQGESCDNGNSNSDSSPDACRTTCKSPSCGDGVVDSNNGETCDDGSSNGAKGSTCSIFCLAKDKNTFCGNDKVDQDQGEECDGTSDCNSDCTKKSEDVDEVTEAVCGNNTVEEGEECDDGNTSNTDLCSDSCKKITVGPTPDESSTNDANGCSAGGILGFLPLFFGAGALKIFPFFKGL